MEHLSSHIQLYAQTNINLGNSLTYIKCGLVWNIRNMMNQAVAFVQGLLNSASLEQKMKIEEEIDFVCTGEESHIKSEINDVLVRQLLG